LCNQLFKISASDLETKVSATNKFYGSKNPQGSRILFVNGDIDPWRALSVTQDGANDITCILISGGSHFQNMFGSLPSDSDDMKKGREKIQAKVSSWISSSPEFETL
jgi:serine protease 16